MAHHEKGVLPTPSPRQEGIALSTHQLFLAPKWTGPLGPAGVGRGLSPTHGLHCGFQAGDDQLIPLRWCLTGSQHLFCWLGSDGCCWSSTWPGSGDVEPPVAQGDGDRWSVVGSACVRVHS